MDAGPRPIKSLILSITTRHMFAKLIRIMTMSFKMIMMIIWTVCKRKWIRQLTGIRTLTITLMSMVRVKREDTIGARVEILSNIWIIFSIAHLHASVYKRLQLLGMEIIVDIHTMVKLTTSITLRQFCLLSKFS